MSFLLTVRAWNWSNLCRNLGGSSFHVWFNLVTGPLIRPITIAKNEFMLLKLLQLLGRREKERGGGRGLEEDREREKDREKEGGEVKRERERC